MVKRVLMAEGDLSCLKRVSNVKENRKRASVCSPIRENVCGKRVWVEENRLSKSVCGSTRKTMHSQTCAHLKRKLRGDKRV